MSPIIVTFRAAAREKILRGAGALADAVRVTPGPKSKSVLIERKWGRPLVCNDGVVVSKMRQGTGNYGFDAACNVYVDLVETGIIDPSKVVRIAWENVVSAASVLLLTEATMTGVPEPREHSHASMEPEME